MRYFYRFEYYLRLGITFIFVITLLVVVIGCGTFQVNTQLVTVTTTIMVPSTATQSHTPTPSMRPTITGNTSTPSAYKQVEIPRLPDAQIIMDINTHLIYRSGTEFDKTVAFYEDQMQAKGWSLENKQQETQDTLLTFSRGDETVNVEIKIDLLGLVVEVSY